MHPQPDVAVYVGDEYCCSDCETSMAAGMLMYSCRICDFDLCQSCHTKREDNQDISVVGGEEMTMPPSSFYIRIKWPIDETQDLSYNNATWPGYRWGLQLESQIRSGTGSVETLWNHRIWEEQSGSQHGTALWFAVREGDQACAERLITMGSNVNQVGQKLVVYNSCGLTFVESAPLLEACVSYNTAMVKLLLGHGAWAQQPAMTLTGCPCSGTMWTYKTCDALGAMLGGTRDVITNKAALWAKPDDKKDAELAVCSIAALLLGQPGVSAVAQTQHTARGDVVDHENADYSMPGFFEHPTRWWLGPRMRGFTPDWPGPVQLGLASALEQLAETPLAHLLPSMMELADCTNPPRAPLVFPMASARRPLAALPAATREFNAVRIKSRFSWAVALALYKAGRATPRDAWMRSGAPHMWTRRMPSIQPLHPSYALNTPTAPLKCPGYTYCTPQMPSHPLHPSNDVFRCCEASVGRPPVAAADRSLGLPLDLRLLWWRLHRRCLRQPRHGALYAVFGSGLGCWCPSNPPVVACPPARGCSHPPLTPAGWARFYEQDQSEAQAGARLALARGRNDQRGGPLLVAGGTRVRGRRDVGSVADK